MKKTNEIKDNDNNYYLCDGLEIKDNEIILYAVAANPQLVFYNLNKNEKIRTLDNLIY